MRKEGPNCGRPFWKCPKKPGEQCDFFQWAVQQHAVPPVPAQQLERPACEATAWRPPATARPSVAAPPVAGSVQGPLPRKCYRVLYTKDVMRRRRAYFDGALLAASSGQCTILNGKGKHAGVLRLPQGRWCDLQPGEELLDIGMQVLVDCVVNEKDALSGKAFRSPSSLRVPGPAAPRQTVSLPTVALSPLGGEAAGRDELQASARTWKPEANVDASEDLGEGRAPREGMSQIPADEREVLDAAPHRFTRGDAERHVERPSESACTTTGSSEKKTRPQGPEELAGAKRPQQQRKRRGGEAEEDQVLKKLKQQYEATFGRKPRGPLANQASWLQQKLDASKATQQEHTPAPSTECAVHEQVQRATEAGLGVNGTCAGGHDTTGNAGSRARSGHLGDSLPLAESTEAQGGSSDGSFAPPSSCAGSPWDWRPPTNTDGNGGCLDGQEQDARPGCMVGAGHSCEADTWSQCIALDDGGVVDAGPALVEDAEVQALCFAAAAATAVVAPPLAPWARECGAGTAAPGGFLWTRYT